MTSLANVFTEYSQSGLDSLARYKAFRTILEATRASAPLFTKSDGDIMLSSIQGVPTRLSVSSLYFDSSRYLSIQPSAAPIILSSYAVMLGKIPS